MSESEKGASQINPMNVENAERARQGLSPAAPKAPREWLDSMMAEGRIQRKLVRLKPGEKSPSYAGHKPPQGYRLESDDELRSRREKTEYEKGASPTLRYSYTDLLAAAWMAKQFGMRIIDEQNYIYSDPETIIAVWREGVHWSCTVDEHRHLQSSFRPECDDFLDIYHRGRYYIHPDSLHLLEPKVGDLIRCDQYHDAITIIDPEEPRIRWDTCMDGGNSCKVDDLTGVVIIQRDGKSFFWPEREAT